MNSKYSRYLVFAGEQRRLDSIYADERPRIALDFLTEENWRPLSTPLIAFGANAIADANDIIVHATEATSLDDLNHRLAHYPPDRVAEYDFLTLPRYQRRRLMPAAYYDTTASAIARRREAAEAIFRGARHVVAVWVGAQFRSDASWPVRVLWGVEKRNVPTNYIPLDYRFVELSPVPPETYRDTDSTVFEYLEVTGIG